MERLTKHWGNNYVATKLNYDFLWEMPKEEFEHFNAIIKKLAKYEDMEEKLVKVVNSIEQMLNDSEYNSNEEHNNFDSRYGYDEGYYMGECNAYKVVLEKLKSFING